MTAVSARRLISMLAFLALSFSLTSVITASPASANSCSIANNDPGFGKRRTCKYSGVYRVGAGVRGVITWNYNDNMKRGDYQLTLMDTAPDGLCAWIKITDPGGTHWYTGHSVCGDGRSGGVGDTINAGIPRYDKGWYRFYLCTGKTANCTLFWEQQIQQPNP